MMRLFNYLRKNPEKLIELLSVLQKTTHKSHSIFEKLIRYCSYDKRKRLNLNQLQFNIFKLTPMPGGVTEQPRVLATRGKVA